MNSVLSRILYDHQLSGEACLRPAKFLFHRVKDSVPKCKEVFETTHLFLTSKHLIPKVGEPTELTFDQCYKFLIHVEGHSDHCIFRHDWFKIDNSSDSTVMLSRTRDPAFANCAFHTILIEEILLRTARAIGWIALSVFTFVATAPLFVAGCTLKMIALCRGENPQKRRLTVTEVPSMAETTDRVAKIARAWQLAASEKASLIPRDNEEREKERDRFDDSRRINKCIAQCMEDPHTTSWVWNRIFECKDEAGELQAVALTSDAYVSKVGHCRKIVHIATNPINIRSQLNAHEWNRVEGAGTALIAHLANSLESDEEGLYLESIKDAKPFYTKLGFVALDDRAPFEVGCISMLLTRDKIKNLTPLHNFRQAA